MKWTIINQHDGNDIFEAEGDNYKEAAYDALQQLGWAIIMVKGPVWEKIQDDQIQHVWEKADDDDCEECPGTVVVPPGWYEDNGTPICDCGQDMAYSHTEILKRNNTNVVKDFKKPLPKEKTN